MVRLRQIPSGSGDQCIFRLTPWQQHCNLEKRRCSYAQTRFSKLLAKPSARCRVCKTMQVSMPLKVAYLPVTAETIDKSPYKRLNLSWRLRACRQAQ